MAKYDPLRDYLRNLALAGQKEVTLNFENLERIIGFPLPKSAHDYSPWWGNDRTHPQAQAWLDAGWEKTMANLETEKVRFQRIERKASVSGRQEWQSDRGTVVPQLPKSFTVKCKYCRGTGIDVRNPTIQQARCPAPGCGRDTIGWHTLPGSKEDYETCHCKGSGVEQHRDITSEIFGNLFEPCRECDGTGLKKKTR